MTYGLPLEFDERIFSSNDLVGTNYLSGFPDIMKAVGNQTYKTTWSDLRTTLDVTLYGRSPDPRNTPKPYVYIAKGYQTVYAKPGRAFLPGADIRIYNRVATGLTRTLIAARVIDYDEVTGKLKFYAYAINYGLDQGTIEANKISTVNARVTIFGSRYVSSGIPQTVVNGGTGANNERDAQKNLGAHNVSDVADFFCDFTHGEEFNDLYEWQNNTTNDFTLGLSATSPEEHPGQIITNPSGGVNGFQFAYGNGTIGKMGTTFSGAGSFIEFCILVPTLPTNVANYNYALGVTRNLGEHDVFAGFGFTLKYSLAARFIANANGVADVITTAVIPAANTWYKLRVTNDGANLVYTVNGTLAATIALSGTTLDLVNDLYMPSFGFGSVGTPNVNGYLDYVHVKTFFGSPRG